MDVILAKALNSTFGGATFKGFDELIQSEFNKINDSIDRNSEKIIDSVNVVKGLVAMSDNYVYNSFLVQRNKNRYYSEIMPCTGSVNIDVVANKNETQRYVDIYINGVLVKEKQKYCTIRFQKGDELNIIENFEDARSTDVVVFMYAKEVNYTGLKFV